MGADEWEDLVMSRKMKTLSEEEFQADLAYGKLIRIVDDHGIATPEFMAWAGATLAKSAKIALLPKTPRGKKAVR